MAILELEKKVSPYKLRLDVNELTLSQFLGRYSPLYDRRLAIISGKVEPTDEEVEAGKKSDEDDEDDDEEEEEGAKVTEIKDEKEAAEEAKTMVGVPEFWLTALRNHVAISETITDADEEVSISCKQRTTEERDADIEPRR